MAESIVIVGAKRTPIGSMQGKFGSSPHRSWARSPSRPRSSRQA
jgi:hypothetical protein